MPLPLTNASALPSICVVIPALNEAGAIGSTVKEVREALHDIPHEIMVVDDGSSDQTGEIARQAGARVVRHPVAGGYGNAIKSGIYATDCDIVGIIDADATYPPLKLRELYQAVVVEGFHMAVGARHGRYYHGGVVKRISRRIFTALARFSSGVHIPDVNSGLRVFRKSDILYFYDTLCSGFSFTTTITLAYIIKGWFIKYIPTDYHQRQGQSKVRHFKDALGSMQIIVQSIIYYNPLKIFLVLDILLILGLLFSMALWGLFGPSQAFMFFIFCCCFLLLLALGLLTTDVSFLANLIKDGQNERLQYSHFKRQLEMDEKNRQCQERNIDPS